MMILAAYLVIINIAAFAVYGIDKHRAVHDRWRIRESVLLTLSAVGGSVGSLAAMLVFHHKTRKTKFRIIVPLTLIVHIAIVIYICMH